MVIIEQFFADYCNKRTNGNFFYIFECKWIGIKIFLYISS